MKGRGTSLLIGIVALAVAVRFPTLDVQSFAHDEAVTAGRVLQPGLLDTLSVVPDSERTPPLYYLLAWLWSVIAGHGEVGLRSLSAVAGVATVPVAYLAGRALISWRAGLIAAALVAVNPFLIFYSQEARSYALVVLLTTLSLWLFARARREATPKAAALWALPAVLALATHYFAAFVVAPQAVLLVLAHRRSASVAMAASMPLVAGLLLLPLALHQGSSHDDAGAGPPSARAVATVASQFALGERLGVGGVSTATPFFALALLGALAWVVWTAYKRLHRGALLVSVIAGVGFLAPLALALLGASGLAGAGFFTAKNVIVVLVPLILLAAFALDTVPSRLGATAITAAVCVGFVGVVVAANVLTGLQRVDWRAAAAALDPAHEGGRVLLVAPGGDDPLLYYLDAAKRTQHAPNTLEEIVILSTTTRPYSGSPPPGFRARSDRTVSGIRLGQFVPGPFTPLSPTASHSDGYTTLFEAAPPSEQPQEVVP